MQWREWSGYFASSAYADAHDIEYNAIREAAALIDVSPLYKYRRVAGPTRTRLVDRVITRDATKLAGRRRLLHAVVRRARQGRRRRHDPPARRATLPLDRGRPAAPLAPPEQPPASTSTIDEETEATAALALQGPLSRDVLEAATGESFADLRYFRRRARPAGRQGRRRRVADRLHRRPRLRAVDPGRARGRGVGRAHGGGGGVRHPAGRDARPRRRPARGRADPARGRLHVGPPRDEPGAELLAVRDRARAARQLRQGRLRRPARARARAARPAVRRGGSSASSSTGTTSRGCTTRRACRRRSARRSTARRSRSSPAAARSAGRRATAGARSSSRRSRSPRSRRATSRSAPASRSSGPSRAAAAGSARRSCALPFLDLRRKRA